MGQFESKQEKAPQVALRTDAQIGTRGYYHDPEEIPVTFQYGLVGQDGVVLASDTRMLGVEKYRTSSETYKIDFDEDLALCCAGDDHIFIVRDKFRAAMKEKGFTTIDARFKMVASEVWNSLYGEQSNQLFHKEKGSILAAHKSTRGIELWLMNFWKEPTSIFIKDKQVAGDGINSAVFFMERYYRENMKIDELLPLAAHTILMGGAMNPTGVGGLDIVVSKNDGFKRLSAEELEPLREFSRKLDEDIRKRIG